MARDNNVFLNLLDFFLFILGCIFEIVVEIFHFVRNPLRYKTRRQHQYDLFVHVIDVLRHADHADEGRDGYLTRNEIQERLNQKSDYEKNLFTRLDVSFLFILREKKWLVSRESNISFTLSDGNSHFYLEWKLSSRGKGVRPPKGKKGKRRKVYGDTPLPELA